MVLSLQHQPNRWIFQAIKRRSGGEGGPPGLLSLLWVLCLSHHSPMPGSEACRVSAGHAKEIHTEDKRAAVWIVKENYAPIIEKHTGLLLGSQAAVL